MRRCLSMESLAHKSRSVESSERKANRMSIVFEIFYTRNYDEESRSIRSL